jgi:hypothetical protein
MATYTFEQLKGMTVAEMRDIAKTIENKALEGYSTLHKEQLLPVLCTVLGIHTHHSAHGARKTELKAQIRKLQAQRQEITTKGGDKKLLSGIRRQVHLLKHELRLMAELPEPPAPKAEEAKPAEPAKA